MSRTLDGRRVVVVGASSGIGRAIAEAAVAEGASVVAAARRSEPLEALLDGSPGHAVVGCDVRSTDGRQELAHTAGTTLGEIDLLVVTVGVAPLTLLADATAADWRETFETNVVAVVLTVQACLPLLAPHGIVAVFSSETVGQPRPALGVYSATKAALDQVIEVWRVEREDVRFSRVVVGSTIDTEFGAAFPDDTLTWALADWQARGQLPATFLLSADVAEAFVGTVAAALDRPSASIDSVTIRPAAPAATPAQIPTRPTAKQ
jgi:NAD(P)-dependent dehydrogenase (short-subunit alcohol dehydrogenase family)